MKTFLITLFIRQNKHHRHSVLVHTLKVFWYALLYKPKFCAAALLHDIGKPFVATLDEDECGYSFTNHEEKSYQIIKNWLLISSYTKDIVRYHYLKRRIIKDYEKLLKRKNSSNGDLITKESIEKMIEIYSSLSENFKKDLKFFQEIDDRAK